MNNQTTRSGLALILVASLLWSCGSSEPPPSETPLRTVRAERVLTTGGKRIRTFSGSARAGTESKLSFRVPGTIQELAVEMGDRVNQGQIIARLDPSDYQLQVEDASASLKQAIAQRDNAKASYARISGLYANNNVSINDLDAARATSESAEAQVQSISKKLELANAQLSYTELRAPLNGSIASINSETAENVQAGQAIAVLNAGSEPEATFVVPEQLVTDIRQGDAVTVRFDAIPDQSFKATITEVGVASGGLGTTYPVIARLVEPNPQIRQGMAAEVTMVFDGHDKRARLLVRPKAVVEDQNNVTFVYIAEPGSDGTATVKRRDVKVGDLTAEGLEVLEGLDEGELLITAGMRFLEEGQQVRLPDGQE